MKNLETLKTRGQESLAHLVDLGKQQPEQVQYWGVTVVAALGGALALAAVAKGVLGIVGTLANPPVALTIGALGGGVFGWSFMQQYTQPQTNGVQVAVIKDVAVSTIPISSASSTATTEQLG